MYTLYTYKHYFMNTIPKSPKINKPLQERKGLIKPSKDKGYKIHTGANLNTHKHTARKSFITPNSLNVIQ